MSSRLDQRSLNTMEERACNEARAHFADHFNEFPVIRLALERVERDMSKIALAANMAAARKPPANPLHADEGNQWYRDVDLMANVYLCHRSLARATEYAVIEHFPSNGRNEVWLRGPNALEVLRLFVHEQRHALQVWKDDLATEVHEYLARHYPDQDMSRTAGCFMRDLTCAIPIQLVPLPAQAAV